MAVFLLFYVAFTVLLTTENSSSLARTFSAAAKSKTTEMRVHSARSSQRRLVEETSTISPVYATSHLTPGEPTPLVSCSEQLINVIHSPALSRAPPTVL
jgi:hypothetical protein